MELVSENVEYYSLDWITQLSEEINCELTGIVLVQHNLVLVTVYRSPLGNFSIFVNTLTTLLNRLKCNIYKVIIGGDFNIHFNSSNKNADRIIDLCKSHGLYKLVSFPTRENATLDNIFSNIPTTNIVVSPIDLSLSDHIGLLIKFESINTLNVEDGEPKMVRSITQLGKLTFFKLMEQVRWDFVVSDIDANNKFTMLVNNIVHNMNIAFPVKSVNCNNYKGNTNGKKHAWFNVKLKKMRETLKFLTDAYNLNKTLELKKLKNEFKCKYNNAIKVEKKNSNEIYLERNGNSPKAMWNIINKHRSKSKTNIPQSNPDEVNSFLANLAENLINSLPPNSLNPISFMPENKNQINFVFHEVSFNEVRNCFNALKNSTAKDIYGLNVQLLKSIKECLIIPLTKSINFCIRESIFPDALKTSIIIPIYKKGDPNDINNYRPISLLPILSKIFEKLLLQQIVEYIEQNKILTNSQFGFRKNMSTSQAILEFINNIIQCFEEKKYYLVYFLDLSKAFDTVSHNILISKLKHYNFSESSTALVTSYLQNRFQKVCINGKISKECLVPYGVPQGSILGPLLFLLYINDLPQSVPEVDTVLYADDTTLGKAGLSLQKLALQMKSQYEIVENWLLANKLHLNKTKTEKIIFTLKKRPELLDYEKEHTKFLGVHVDSMLTWHKHIDTVADKLCKNIYLLFNLKSCVSQKSVKAAYFALIHSQLEYCVLLWGHTGASARLFRLQRRAIRILAGVDFRDDCSEHFKILNILTLPSLYILKCLDYAVKHIEDYKTLGSFHEYNTRSDYISFNSLRLTKTRHGTNYYCIKFMNVLPSSFKKLPNVTFMNKIKRYLITKKFYSTEEYLKNDFRDILLY